MPPAYLIVDTVIEDHEAYDRYKALTKPLAETFGGEYLARGGELPSRGVIRCLSQRRLAAR